MDKKAIIIKGSKFVFTIEFTNPKSLKKAMQDAENLIKNQSYFLTFALKYNIVE